MKPWPDELRAEAIGLARAQGAKAAAKATGIPRRTVSDWLTRIDRGERISVTVQAAILATEEAVAERLWETMQLGLEEVRAGLLSPTAKLGDKARALEVIANQWQLITGRATSRTENANLNIGNGITDSMSEDEKEQAREWLLNIARANLDPDETLALRSGLDREAQRRDTAEALEVATTDPLSLSNAQIDGLIRALEASIGDE